MTYAIWRTIVVSKRKLRSKSSDFIKWANKMDTGNVFGFFKILNCFCGVLCFMFAFVVSNVRNTNTMAMSPEAKVTAVVREEEAKERLCWKTKILEEK